MRQTSKIPIHHSFDCMKKKEFVKDIYHFSLTQKVFSVDNSSLLINLISIVEFSFEGKDHKRRKVKWHDYGPMTLDSLVT